MKVSQDTRIQPVANLLHGHFEGEDLSGRDIQCVNASYARFDGADLSRSNLRRSFLYEASLRNAKCDGTIFRDANLCGADLRDADFNSADMSGVWLVGAIIDDGKGNEYVIQTN
jgi:uncharacterized protein YjbI with pentapeptide repeats